MQSNLSDRIWDKFQARRRVVRRAISASTIVVIGGAALALTAWPRPAMAIQELKLAMTQFNSVKWTQNEEGTIRDMGSDDPATVPAFKQSVSHYLSYRPAEIQLRIAPSVKWLGTTRKDMIGMVRIQDGPPVKRPTYAYYYAEGPSSNLGPQDIDPMCNELTSLKSFLAQNEVGQKTEYQGKPALKFHVQTAGEHICTDDVILADPSSKRMVYRRFEVTRPSGQQLFLRELVDFEYDGPSPVAKPVK